MTGAVDLELGWRRLRWEALLPLREPLEWCFFPPNLRRFEVQRANADAVMEAAGRRLSGDPPGAWEDVPRRRGLRLRPYACLSLADYVLLLASLASCHGALGERFAATDGRRDLTFSLSRHPGDEGWLSFPLSQRPYEQAAGEPARREQQLLRNSLNSHTWWLHVDICNFSETIDYRRLWLDLVSLGLPRSARRPLLLLLADLCRGRRQGLPVCGRISAILAKMYVHSVISELDRRGYHFFFTGLDEFDLFFDHRHQAIEALDQVRELLAARGLFPNYHKTWLVPSRRALWEQRWQRFRWENVRHRAASWWAGRDSRVERVVDILYQPLVSGLFLFKRPDYVDMLRYPATQLAFLKRLCDPDVGDGDRAFLLLYLHESGVGLQGPLQEHVANLARQSVSGLVRDLAGALVGS